MLYLLFSPEGLCRNADPDTLGRRGASISDAACEGQACPVRGTVWCGCEWERHRVVSQARVAHFCNMA